MSKSKRSPSFKGLKPATSQSSSAAKASSIKTGTRCEVLLRRKLFARGLRYRLDAWHLPGRPDIIFAGPRVVIFATVTSGTGAV